MKKKAFYYLCLGCLFSLIYCNLPREISADPEREEWISLFNGKDMTGWTPKIRGFALGDNHLNTFRVSDGALQCNYDQYENFDSKFGHLFYEDSFSYYHLRVEYRTVGDETIEGAPGWAFRNNGLMLHCQAPETMGLEQDFPISLELQLLSGNGTDERSTANLCTPGTHVHVNGELVTDHCMNSTSRTYHGDTWVKVEALVYGDSLVHHLVEGDTVFTFTHPVMGDGVVNGHDPNVLKEGKPITGGYISIQGESHNTEFRRIELLNLCGCKDKEARNFKSYYVKADNSTCIY